MNKYSLIFSIAFGICGFAFGQRESFIFDRHVIKQGEKISFQVPVKSKTNDSTFIPVTVIQGKENGPVLGLIAGIHGYEYPPIMALQKLSKQLNPEEVRGTIIIVHIANVRSFLGRSVFYSPPDGKNLNRSFPGNKNGTLTECVAWAISSQILSRCHYLVDIHAGDASEDLHPYVTYYNYGTQTEKAKQMAEALNFPWIIINENVPKPGQPTIYCSAEAVSGDIPTVAIEYGKLGQVKPEEAAFINNSLLNMMKSINVIPGLPDRPNIPFEIRKRISISSEHAGIFYTDFKSGELIRKGTRLGSITDLFGNVVQEIISPVNGFIIYLSTTPPINKGETLFSIAEY